LEIFVVLVLILSFGFYFITKKNYKVKNTAIKKEEIILGYENKLRDILSQFANDKAKQIEKKKIFLRNCNSELSRNIFFTHEESVKIIERLIKL